MVVLACFIYVFAPFNLIKVILHPQSSAPFLMPVSKNQSVILEGRLQRRQEPVILNSILAPYDLDRQISSNYQLIFAQIGTFHSRQQSEITITYMPSKIKPNVISFKSFFKLRREENMRFKNA